MESRKCGINGYTQGKSSEDIASPAKRADPYPFVQKSPIFLKDSLPKYNFSLKTIIFIGQLLVSISSEQFTTFKNDSSGSRTYCSFAQSYLTVTSRTAAHQASLSFTISQSLLKLMSTEPMMLSNHLILCQPLFLPPSIFPSIRAFFNELTLCILWPKYWSFSFSINPSNEYSGLISLKTDWFDLFAVQGTLKSLLQHHSSKASILRHSIFFMIQVSHLYMTTGKKKKQL